MANSIPPLLCNTPPPMDGGCFDEDDEDDRERDGDCCGSLADDDQSPASSPSRHLPLPTVNDLPPPINQRVVDSRQPPRLPGNNHDDDDSPPNVPTAEAASVANSVRQSPPPLSPPADFPPDLPPSFADAYDPPPPPIPAFASPSPSPPLFPPPATAISSHSIEYRSESPPSLHLQPDAEDVDDEELSAAFSDADNAAELPQPPAHAVDDDAAAGRDEESPSSESSLPSLQLSAPTEEANSVAAIIAAEPLPCLEDVADDDDDDEERAEGSNQTSRASPLTLNDSFEEFVEYEEATRPAERIESTDCNSNTLKQAPTEAENVVVQEKAEEVVAFEEASSNAADFGADFSQFASFEAFEAKPAVDQLPAGDVLNRSDAIASVDDADDDDDDFGDFADVVTTAAPAAAASFAAPDVPVQARQQLRQEEADDEHDDFGDFSDFQQNQAAPAAPAPAPAPISIDLAGIGDRVGPVLQMMFALNAGDASEAENEEEKEVSPTADRSVLQDSVSSNRLTRAVMNVDEPVASRHQWLASEGKGELVRALGIDTAKIWNQSMPRFAANLGFSPLEPLKPRSATIASNFTADGILRPTQVAPTSTTKTATTSSLAGRTAAGPEVPAAQFDWTGSGLVNPLDEQLVVAANLDNLTLASSAACPDAHSATTTTTSTRQPQTLSSSSSSSSSATSSPTYSRPLPNPPNPSNPHNPPNPTVFIAPLPFDHHNRPHRPQTSSRRLPTSAAKPTPLGDPLVMFDHYLDSRVQAILHEAGHPQNRPSRPDADWANHDDDRQQHQSASASVPSAQPLQPSPAIAAAAAAAAEVPLDNSNSAISATTPPPPSASLSNSSHQSQAISRIVPAGHLGGLKETHIFTPSKARTLSGCSVASNSGAGVDDVIVIDETVVTKEYRDVEYNPQPVAPAPLSPAPLSAGSSLSGQLQQQQQQCLQPTRTGIVIEWPEPGQTLSGPQLDAFEEFDAGGGQNEPSACAAPNSNPVESFDEFLSATAEPVPVISNGNPSADDDSFDDFSAFQFVPLPVPTKAPEQPSVPQLLQPMIAGGILQPQPMMMLQPQKLAEPQLSWSQAGETIDPDEMARLEAIYPTPKAAVPTVPAAAVPTIASPAKSVRSDDAEWTDFVSSDAGYQPITHIISQNILRHQAQQQPAASAAAGADDDDWTDFMSGGTANAQAPTGNGPAWNGSAMWQPAAATFLPNVPALANQMPATLRLSPKHAGGLNGGAAVVGQQHFATAVKAKPSISLIPDLGMVFGRGAGAGSHQQQQASSTAAYRK